MKIKTILPALLAAGALLFVGLMTALPAKQARAAEVATNIAVEETAITLQLGGDPVQLTLTVTPDTATEGTGVTWLAENPNVVAVDYDNKVHALSVGTTVLYMIPDNTALLSEEDKYLDSLTVTVEATEAVLEGIALDKSEHTGEVGEQFYLVPEITPDGMATNVIWRSSDTRVAIVNNGTVMLVGEGVCTVSIADENGQFSASCSVTVKAAGSGGAGGTNTAAIIAGSVCGGVAVVAAVVLGLVFGLKKGRKNA